MSRIKTDEWFVRHAQGLSRGIEIIFGAIWLLDSYFKFQPGFESSFSDLVSGAAEGQPAWLSGWFSFWASFTASHPYHFAFLIALLELALGASLLLGFARKLAYGGGFLLSVVIWSVPEGFGGPYGPSSTDIGTGIIYALVFLLLAVLNATYGASDYTLDKRLEKRIGWWEKIAEIRY